MCYVYAIPLSWELPRIRGVRKAARATPLLSDDFAMFADVTSHLVTADNEGYPAVLIGKAARGGAGLLSEVGLATQVSVVNMMKEKSKGSFRAKQIRLNYSRACGPVPARARGVSGTMSDTLYLFYKGTWPSKLELHPREKFGGTSWDDMWCDVPFCPNVDHCSVPQSIKKMVFEDVWAGNTMPDPDVEDGGDDEGDGAGQTAPDEGDGSGQTPQPKTKAAKAKPRRKKDAKGKSDPKEIGRAHV